MGGIYIEVVNYPTRPGALAICKPASQVEPLQVAAGTPGLYLTRTTYDQRDNMVEFDQEFWRYDVLEVSIEVPTAVVATAPIVASPPPRDRVRSRL